jgi:glycosyltransferase involved in cell wall biosynthesis
VIIGIDARFALGKRRGIGNYVLKLVQNLAEIDTHNQYVLYTDCDDKEGVLPKRSNFRERKISPSNYLVWEQIALPARAKRDGIQVLHCTGNTAPLFLDRRIKLISSIHDVMYLKDYSEVPKSASLYQRAGRFYRKMIVPRTIDRLVRVLTISKFSKYDILAHFPELDDETVTVIYEAANECYRTVDKVSALQRIGDKFDFAGDYILTLGALDPRKNTELVINKYLELKAENSIREKLLIVGIPNWRRTKFFSDIEGSKFQSEIIFADYVSEADLVDLYNCAKVFLYPSLYEGFGIPLLEAMACGAPVITSNTTSVPEVVGDAALLINPRSGTELGGALMTLLTNEDLRTALISRGRERAKEFSWKKVAEKTLEIYQQVGMS